MTSPERGGFDSKLIERALAAKIGGKAEIEYRAAGVRFTLEAPLPERVAVAPGVEFAIQAPRNESARDARQRPSG